MIFESGLVEFLILLCERKEDRSRFHLLAVKDLPSLMVLGSLRRRQ